jgi:hypothetical protein
LICRMELRLTKLQETCKFQDQTRPINEWKIRAIQSGGERARRKKNQGKKSPERVVHDQATSNDTKHGRVLGLVPVRRRRNGIGRGASELARQSDEGEKARGNLEGTEGCWWGGEARQVEGRDACASAGRWLTTCARISNGRLVDVGLSANRSGRCYQLLLLVSKVLPLHRIWVLLIPDVIGTSLHICSPDTVLEYAQHVFF